MAVRDDPPPNQPDELDYSFTIPLPPSVNACWRNVPGVGRVKTGEYKDWIKAASIYTFFKVKRPIASPITVFITLTLPPNADLDNRVKPIMDLLVETKVLQDDNCTIVRRVDVRCEDWVEQGMAEVNIVPYVPTLIQV